MALRPSEGGQASGQAMERTAEQTLDSHPRRLNTPEMISLGLVGVPVEHWMRRSGNRVAIKRTRRIPNHLVNDVLARMTVINEDIHPDAGEEISIRESHRPTSVYSLYLRLLENEAKTLAFVRKHTSIPVPAAYGLGYSQEDGKAYLQMDDLTHGTVTMASVPETDPRKTAIYRELSKYTAELHSFDNGLLGAVMEHAPYGKGGIMDVGVVPYEVVKATGQASWNLWGDSRGTFPYVLCHGNLTQENVHVDPETYEIRAITEWGYAGYWPPEFEGKRRLVPGLAEDEEVCYYCDGAEKDVDRMVKFMREQECNKIKQYLEKLDENQKLDFWKQGPRPV